MNRPYTCPTGVIPPMVTPLRGGRVDPAVAAAMAARLVATGVDGVFVLGSCGEGATLTAEARRELLTAVVGEIGGQSPVFAGVIETSTSRAVQAARLAADAGADLLVVTPPQYFIPAGHDATVRHVRSIADAVELPIVLYNIPHLTHNPITPAALADLAAIPAVVGLKDSAAVWDSFAELLKVGQAAGIKVFQGAERLVLRSIEAGADGAVPGIANLDPALAVELVRAARDGEADRAKDLHGRLDRLCQVFDHGFWLSALKQAMSERGFCSPEVGAPLPVSGDADRTAIHRLLVGEGLLP